MTIGIWKWMRLERLVGFQNVQNKGFVEGYIENVIYIYTIILNKDLRRDIAEALVLSRCF